MQRTEPWRSAARTDRGKVRARNEDAFLDCPDRGLWAVADGMGGHQAGDLASRMIVTSLAELPARAGFDERLNAMRQCLHWLNRRLGEELTLSAERGDRIIGSTVVALVVEGSRAACVWVGTAAATCGAASGCTSCPATTRCCSDWSTNGGWISSRPAPIPRRAR